LDRVRVAPSAAAASAAGPLGGEVAAADDADQVTAAGTVGALRRGNGSVDHRERALVFRGEIDRVCGDLVGVEVVFVEPDIDVVDDLIRAEVDDRARHANDLSRISTGDEVRREAARVVRGRLGTGRRRIRFAVVHGFPCLW
jgi:hypothetical protein